MINDKYIELIRSRRAGKIKFETRLAVLEVLHILKIEEFQRHVCEFDNIKKEFLDFKIPKNKGFTVLAIKDRYKDYLYIKSKKHGIEILKRIEYPETVFEYTDFVYLGIENPFYFLEKLGDKNESR